MLRWRSPSFEIAGAAPSAAHRVATEAHRHRWWPEEYVRLSEIGSFAEWRTELLDGDIFDVPQQDNAHVATVSNSSRVFLRTFDERYWVTVRSTIRLPRGDMPAPDVAVRPGPLSTDDSVHPLPLIVVEVSDQTLLFDQTIKASLYAANGIADYWVLNVVDRQLEVYRDPVADPTRRYGARYASVNTFRPGQRVSPLALPTASIEIERMLP